MQKLFLPVLLIMVMSTLFFSRAFSQTKSFDKKTIYKLADRDVTKHLKLAERLQENSNNPAEPHLKSGAETNLSNSKEAESEIHAAINPLDSNNMIVASMQYSAAGGNPLLGQQALSVLIYYTKDGGKSWKTSTYNPLELPLLSLLYGGGDPVLAFDPDGKAYLSFLLVEFPLVELKFTAKLSFAISNNGGETWGSQGVIDQVTFLSFTDSNRKIVDKEWVATDQSNSSHRGNLYCAFTEVNIADTTYNIFVKRKLNKENAFDQNRIPITKGAFAFAQFVTLDVDAKGVVHLLFAGAKPEDEVLSLFYSSSLDGGKTFSTPLKTVEVVVPCFPPVAGVNCSVLGFANERIYACPSIVVDKSTASTAGNLYITWSGLDIYQQNQGQGMDVFFIRSTDSGKTWSPPLKLNRDKLSGIEQFYPSTYVNDKGLLMVSWYDRREDSSNRIGRYYMSTSCDGGLSFAPESAVGMQAMDFTAAGKLNGGFGIGEYTQIIASGSSAFPFWADGRSNDGNLEVMTSKIPLLCNRTVAVREIKNLFDDLILHRIYPNPASSSIQLELESATTGELSVKLIGVDGREALKQKVDILEGPQKIPLELKQLNVGMYWLELQFHKSRIAVLLVKK